VQLPSFIQRIIASASASSLGVIALFVAAVCIVGSAAWQRPDPLQVVPNNRQEVVFWHFWGGDDQAVVEAVVRRFNESQENYYVRPVAMPGNNLSVKLFLSVSGGDPPDLINQDDPIIADWATAGALTPLDEVATPAEMAELNNWLFPAARRLTEFEGRSYGLCNGLDVRALYYNRTLLDRLNIAPPETLAELDALAEAASADDEQGRRRRYGYLPDPRRLWAWGIVFGGAFISESTGEPTADNLLVVAALKWMQSYGERYGVDELQRFRTGDQSLPGKSFPLLPQNEDAGSGRYAMMLDGQWRVRDIAASNAARSKRGWETIQYGVCPLPSPPNGKPNAGWVNGNYFLIPKNAHNSAGAWAFMKFWSGFGHENEAAQTCAEGGWIPVSGEVVRQSKFQQFMHEQPLFAKFVELAASENQQPIPIMRGASVYNQEIKTVGSAAMYAPEKSPRELLERVNEQVKRTRK